ncbi:MAG: hypothetical protein FWC09_06180 [Lachnospiraceae bacterium]|nr:hypothetical protein [Lachnospiraceae bacterium]
MNTYGANVYKSANTLKETDKKCPSCAGIMSYDPVHEGLSCPFCGYTEKITDFKKENKTAEELCISTADRLENCNWGAEKKSIICSSCGAESIYDALQISAVCSFCDSNNVMEASCDNTMAPGGVVPFKISDQQAANLFKNWIKKKWFSPKMAKNSAKADRFLGIYLPYWTFDADTESNFKADYGIDKRVKKGDRIETVTKWFKTRGNHLEKIDDELVVATTNHNQSMLRGLEPFNTADNKAYKPEYIAGFVAERYAIGIKDAWNFAKQMIGQRLNRNIEARIRKDNNADRVRNLKISTTYTDITYKYLLLPIWVSHYTYQDKVYHFMVNGQTGKVSGKAPISIIKVMFAIVGSIAILAALSYLGVFG